MRFYYKIILGPPIRELQPQSGTARAFLLQNRWIQCILITESVNLMHFDCKKVEFNAV